MTQKLKALEEKLLHGSSMESEKLSEKTKELALRERQIREKEFIDEEQKRKIIELEVTLHHLHGYLISCQEEPN